MLLFLLSAMPYFTFASSINNTQNSISVGNSTIKLNILTIPDNGEYDFKVVHSNPIGSVSDLKTLVSKSNGIAGINGTFFEAYELDSTKRYPNGLLIENSKLIRVGSNPAFIYDGQKKFGKLEIKITGAINGSYKWPNNWYAWSINHVFTANEQVVIYNTNFGRVPDDGCLNVMVQKGKVTSLSNKPTNVPSDGYVIHIGQGETIKNRFHVGDSVEYKVDYLLDGKPLTTNIKFGLGAGPTLITNGHVDIDFERDGFTSDKIKILRSTRSFVGIDKNGSIVIGTTPLASIKELASALLKFGLTDAMNLDGGASSGMFYSGKYISTPGRQISNVLVVVKKTYPTTNIIVNKEILEQNGIIKNNITYVPLRGILERLGIEVVWNSKDSTVDCKKGTANIPLSIGSKSNSEGFLLNSKSYVPLRLISERFGYKVNWNSQTKSVEIKGNL